MSRRIILGRNGSDYAFRVARPGFDAATASLDNLVFDADNIPTRVAATGLTTIGGVVQPNVPVTVDIAHGANPSLCIGVAQSQYINSNYPETDHQWEYMIVDPDILNGKERRALIENTYLALGWCAPWILTIDADGIQASGGWRIQWTSTLIRLHNLSPHPIRVRWAALEF